MMKRYLVCLLFLGSCATTQPPTVLAQQQKQLSMNVATIFKDCDAMSLKTYPIVKKTIPKGQPNPTVVCKLNETISCEEQDVQTVTEVDSNEKLRKAYMMECLRVKLGAA